jgi:Tol biopolymer transport system component
VNVNARLVRLTTAGVNVDPALSPDGSLLAYASDRAESGNFDIWIQRIDGGEPMRLTSDASDEIEPWFSPDGESIVFSQREHGGVYVVSVHGGNPTLLMPATRARTPRLSPDGRWVAFWTGQTFKTTRTGVPGPRVPGTINALMLMPSAGGFARALAEDFVSARYPVWSPDSSSILFLGEHMDGEGSAALDWFVMPIAGGAAHPTGAVDALTRAGVEGIPVPAVWTTSGEVLFTAETDQAANVWRLAVSPATGRVGGPPEQLTLGTAVERSPAISKAGLLVFDSVVENVDVWRVPLDRATGIADGALERITDNASIDRLGNVSADGRTMVFISSRSQRDEVWLKDLRTRVERQLTSSGAIEARISPDGATVAVSSLSPAEIHLLPVAGGEPSRLCENCGEGAWSMDGTRFIFGRGTPRQRIVVDVRTKIETPLAGHPHWNLLQPRFSPGDEWVLFHTTNTPVVRQIYAVPVRSGSGVPIESWIPIVTDYGIYPSWAPDGSGVYYFSSRDGFYCAWLQPVDPRTKRPLGDPRPVRHFHEPRLRAAAGTNAMNDVQAGYLYVSLTETSGNIWMMK